jgi:hypothetical protein
MTRWQRRRFPPHSYEYPVHPLEETQAPEHRHSLTHSLHHLGIGSGSRSTSNPTPAFLTIHLPLALSVILTLWPRKKSSCGRKLSLLYIRRRRAQPQKSMPSLSAST